MTLRRTAFRPAVAAGISLALVGLARAEGLSVSAEPTYRHAETDVTDQAGRTTHERQDGLTQRYRLAFDRTLTSFLSVAAGATLVDDRSWKETDDVWLDDHSRATSLFSRLTLGTPVLNAALGADWREQRRFGYAGMGIVVENYAGHVAWRPRDLPEIDLQAGRVNTFDTGRTVQDTTTDSASFGVRYNTREYDVRYLLSWVHATDHLRLSETTTIEQAVLGTRSDTLFGGRTFAHVSGTLQTRNSSTDRQGEGGEVERQQLPVQGLSAVEVPPATAIDLHLEPNPLVVDGDLTRSASLNVGFGPRAAGDRDARHMGAGFADAITRVNRIYVWLDRVLPANVSAPLASTVSVYQSNDNQHWSPVAIVGSPSPSDLYNRIEIGIAETSARFLKVALFPLPEGVTNDPAHREIFVTELQFLLVLPVAAVPRRDSATSASLTATARTIILRSPDLTHDATVAVARPTEDVTTYTVVNGLTLAHKLTAHVAGNARGARLDQDLGRGREGAWEWSAALIGTPVPAARWTLTYSGRATDVGEVMHSLAALGRADWYEGISTQANAGVSRGTAEVERGLTTEIQTTTTFDTSGRISLTPNRFATLSTGAQYSRSLASSPSAGDLLTQFARVDGTLSLTPAPALSANGTLSRVLLGTRPTTLGTVSLNYFPLRGDLQLAFAYSKTLDTAAEATTELFSPSLRWNIRRGVSLRSTYTALESDAPAQILSSRAVEATLLITM